MTSTLAIEQIAFAREIQRRAKAEIEVQSHTLRTASEQIAHLTEQLTQPTPSENPNERSS